MNMNELLDKLVGETDYEIKYYGDDKLIKTIKCDEKPKLMNVEACIEDIAEYVYMEFDNVRAEVFYKGNKIETYDLL